MWVADTISLYHNGDCAFVTPKTIFQYQSYDWVVLSYNTNAFNYFIPAKRGL